MHRIAVLWGKIWPSIQAEVQRGIDDALRGSGVQEVRHHISFEDLFGGRTPADLVERIVREADGLLVAFAEIDETAARFFETAGLPAVLVASQQTGAGGGSVSVDHADGARQAARALVDLGRRRLAYVGLPPERGRIWADRFGAVEEVARSAGGALEFEREATWEIDEAAAAVRRLLERAPDVDGMVFTSDLQALGGMKTLREMGIDVPSDVSVIGFDDTEAGHAAHPPLSSVRQPFRRMGEEGARMLRDAVAGDAGALARRVLPVELVLRGSALPPTSLLPLSSLPPSSSTGLAPVEEDKGGGEGDGEGGWHVRALGKSFGPYSVRNLSGWLRPETFVRHEARAPDWTPARKARGLQTALAARRPPLEWWFVRRPGGEAYGPVTRQALVAMIDSGEVRPQDEIRHAAWDGFSAVRSTQFHRRALSRDVDLSGLSPEEIRRPPATRRSAAAAVASPRAWPEWLRRTALLAAAAAVAVGLSWGYRRYGTSESAFYREHGRPQGDCASDSTSREICSTRPGYCGCAREAKGSCGMEGCRQLQTILRDQMKKGSGPTEPAGQ